MQVVPLVDIVSVGTAVDMLAVGRVAGTVAVGTAVVAGTVVPGVLESLTSDRLPASRSCQRLPQ